jgi:hypothetical protein
MFKPEWASDNSGHDLSKPTAASLAAYAVGAEQSDATFQ